MNNKYPFAQAILEQTNGGLTIILDYYNEASTSKKFKIRQEKTTSAILKQVEGTYLVYDYGQWEKPKNAIGVCMFEDNLSYNEACSKLAKLYNVEYQGKSYTVKPLISKRPRAIEEQKNSYIFEYNETLTADELKIFGSKITDDIAQKYHLKSVKSFSYIKENEVFTTTSTKDYPIFVFDYGDWQKIYQPKSTDKQYRFRYAGKRPKNFIFGLDEIKRKYKRVVEQYEEEYQYNEDDKKKKTEPKLDDIIICSGDKDALNMASFGYNVIWLNSETANLDFETYKILTSMSNNVYNLPDIDNTGKKQAVKLALKYIDLKTIWLPDYLKNKRDFRGNKCKDVSDFIFHFYKPTQKNKTFSSLKKLVQNALPVKFWDETINEKTKKIAYYFNIVNSQHFLKLSGFYRYETPQEKEEYCYIHIYGNIVKRVTPNVIENFANNFLRQRQIPIPIRNMVLKTPYLKEATLSKLPIKTLDFVDAQKDKQFWFFKNFTLEITKNGLVTHKAGEIEKYVWEETLINHNANARNFIENPHFKIFKDKDGDLDIEILNTNNKYFNYLINTSRIHWRKDLEDSFKNKTEKEAQKYYQENKFNIAGENLNKDEILEQKLHLINKIYALGYILHKFKDKSKSWFVFAMDNKLSDIGESHGGSGKSLALDYLNLIMKNRFYIPGRNKNATQNDFIYDGVTRLTDYIFIDDMNQYFDFQHFFSDITASMKINPKNNKSFELKFEESPKLCGTSNFPPRDLDPSTARRILFMVFSDYYHYNKDNEYNQTRQVSDDFGGKNLFDDFNDTDFNNVYNFWAQCVQFYLNSKNKIEPPMENVTKRNLISEMGAAFNDWVYIYFSEESGRLDSYVSKPEAYADFKKKTSSKLSSNRFKKALGAFCKYNNYILNPLEYRNAKGRIIKNLPNQYGERVSTEVFYIKTKKAKELQPDKIDKIEDDIKF